VSTDLFQALTLGLLVIVILALLVAVSMLGKVRAALEDRAAGERTPGDSRNETETTATVDEVVAEVAGAEPASAGEPDDAGPAAVTTGSDTTEDRATRDEVAGDEDSERPFERAGRWYFRRAGELLVYEEGTGEWVPAEDGGGTDASPEVRRHADAVDASTEPSGTEPAAERSDTGSLVATESRSTVEAEPSTSFAGQPLATAEEEVATLGGEAAGGGDTAVATGFGEPGGGEVDLDEAATADLPAARSSESFWKCTSCGAINGSTATSCRMCFSARP
jgi:hypothetical protein